jgi:tol-pal system protein YbgF
MAVILTAGSAPAAAADKAHQQLMAEIRMLQEQQQQLQQVIGGLTDALKSVNAKLDEQASTSRKAFADHKLLVDNVSEGVRILREKADDTNVRLSTVSQELEAVRHAVSSIPSAPVGPPAGQEPAPVGGEPGTTAPPNPGAGNPGAQGGFAMLTSPQKMFDNAYSDYTAGQWDLAISGFTAFMNSFPKHDKADDAQLNVGQSYYGAGKYREALDAFQKVITNYPQSDSVPVAYYKMGMTYEALKQFDPARKAFDALIQKYPAAYEAILAKQRLDSLKGK